MNQSRKAETLSCVGCGKSFERLASGLGLKVIKSRSDIAVIGEYLPQGSKAEGEILFCPDTGTDCVIKCVSAVTAGMGPKATLGFSSICDSTAALSVSREVDFFGKSVEPCEIPVKLDESLSIYENIIYGFLNHFL
jgi:hypothetical protein